MKARIASFFGAGHLPFAPGSWGSLAILPLAALVQYATGIIGLVVLALLLFLLGLWALHGTHEDDPPWIVIDEAAGQALALLPAMLSFGDYCIAFILFRIFDIAKPWPAHIIDKRLKSSLGIMLDDTAAALYAIGTFVGLRALGLF